MSVRRRVFVDISPWRRSREFRLLFNGQLVSFLGSQLTVVAVPLQVFRITHSSLDVGLVGLAQLGPLLVGSLIGGTIVDATDRRRLLLIMEVLLATTSAGLALNAATPHPALWPLYVLTAASAGFSGVDRPARSVIIANVVDASELPAAFALWQIQIQLAVVAGPALAGLLIGGVGLATTYWIDVATFGVALFAVARMRPLPRVGGGTKAGLGSILEGFRFVKDRPVLQGVFVIDINAMVFGAPRALFPALGTEVFHGGTTAVGLLYAAPGAGALIAALTTGWVGRVRRQGRAVVIAVAIWGAAISVFGLMRSLPFALVLLAVAGAADVVSAVFRSTMLQTSIPDSLRGRLSAVQIAVVTGGPRLGDAEAGAMAALTDVRFSVVSGGLACMVGSAVVARLLPEFVGYHRPDQGGG